MTRPRAAAAPFHTAVGSFVVGLLVAAVAASAVSALAPAIGRWVESVRHADESPHETLVRQRGEAYATALRLARQRIPASAVYGLIDAVDLHEGGGYWVRHDLAPRRPIYLGTVADVLERPGSARLLVQQGSLLVVAHAAPEPLEVWGGADLEHALSRPDDP